MYAGNIDLPLSFREYNYRTLKYEDALVVCLPYTKLSAQKLCECVISPYMHEPYDCECLEKGDE